MVAYGLPFMVVILVILSRGAEAYVGLSCMHACILCLPWLTDSSTGPLVFSYGDENACWLVGAHDLTWAFLAPVAVVLLLNLALLVSIIRNIIKSTSYNFGGDDFKGKLALWRRGY